MNLAAVPVMITEEATAAVAELGMQRELELKVELSKSDVERPG